MQINEQPVFSEEKLKIKVSWGRGFKEHKLQQTINTENVMSRTFSACFNWHI